MGTLTTRDRYGRVRAETPLDIDPEAVAAAVAEIEAANDQMRTLKKDDEGRAKKRNGAAIETLKASSLHAAASMGLEPVLFRMLENDEIHRGMAFDDDFVMPADVSKRTATRLYGNAVTPPAAEVIASALMEVVLGVELDRELVSA
jgi:site-specific DNA-cytosine methylase